MSRHESPSHLSDPRRPPDDASRELAALAALGSLEGDDAARFDEHLRVCAACRAEVEAHRGVVHALAEAGPIVPAPESLRSRLMAAVAADAADGAKTQPWKSWSATTGDVLLLGALQGGWEATAVPGIETRRLFVDEAADRVTMLVRMAPGTAYPAHRHGGPEECFVLEGDLDVGAARMTAGSYQRLAQGSTHPIQSTQGGCVLLLVSSLRDELLAS